MLVSCVGRQNVQGIQDDLVNVVETGTVVRGQRRLRTMRPVVSRVEGGRWERCCIYTHDVDATEGLGRWGGVVEHSLLGRRCRGLRDAAEGGRWKMGEWDGKWELEFEFGTFWLWLWLCGAVCVRQSS